MSSNCPLSTRLAGSAEVSFRPSSPSASSTISSLSSGSDSQPSIIYSREQLLSLAFSPLTRASDAAPDGRHLQSFGIYKYHTGPPASGRRSRAPSQR